MIVRPPVSLRLSIRRLLQLWARDGVLRTVRSLAAGAAPPLLYPGTLAPAVHPFDLAYRVETSGFRNGEELGATGLARARGTSAAHGSALWATAYYGVAPSIFDRALALTDVADWDRFTFLDLGCGKGRALLLASRFPFQAILGVELDADLAAIAQGNLRTCAAPWQQCHVLEARHADVLQVELPPTPLLLYLYHPFLAPVLKRVLRRLERSVRLRPREIWLVYVNPEAAAVLKRFPFLREYARARFVLPPEDALADRLGSSQEEVAIFHFTPTPP